MKNRELEKQLVVGAKIRLGKKYAKKFFGKAGEVITLIEGHFDYDNGLYCEDQTAPSVWNEPQRDYDSIYHLFGNNLEDFMDCEIVTAADPQTP